MPEALLKEPLSLLSRADASRRIANGKLKVETKSAFGQYMTPATVASFLASLFPVPSIQNIRLLDPGAGVGSLTSAFVEHICTRQVGCHIDVDAYEVDPLSPLGFFDRELVASVLGNCINNAIRYARESLLITVSDEAGQLVISINDDGDGYPAQMLERQADYVQGINHSSGSTGLGLYFANRIAALHQRNGVEGRTEIGNGGPLGGGVFSLYLP